MEIRMLSSADDLASAARLAYEIYVEDLRVLGGAADHERRLLDTDSKSSSQTPGRSGRKERRSVPTMGAFVDGQLIGTLSAMCWADDPFPDLYHSAFQVHRFATVVPRERMAILTRWTVRRDHRRGLAALRLYQSMVMHLIGRDIALIFADCQPNRLTRYRWLGLRPFGRVFNYADSGVVIPLVGIPSDHDHLRGTRSPTLAFLPASTENKHLAARLNEILVGDGPVTTSTSDPEGYWSAIEPVTDELTMRDRNPFAGLAMDDLRPVLERGYLLSCAQGDLVIGQDHDTRTVYVVLEGELEVRCPGVRRRLGRGEICGELAFLLDSRRTASVYVASRTARLLCLDDRDVKSVGKNDPKLAARFLANLSRIPARRLAEPGMTDRARTPVGSGSVQ